MSNERNYDYFALSEEKSSELLKQYESEIRPKREAAQDKLLKDTGAIAWVTFTSWNDVDYIGELVYRPDAVPEGRHILVCGNDWYEGELVVKVRGRRNTKAGIEFNTHMDVANEALRELPDFCDWLVFNKYKLNRTGLGDAHPTGKGVSMLRTRGGMAGESNRVVFMIPNVKTEEWSGETNAIPDYFERITYGQYYDLVNS